MADDTRRTPVITRKAILEGPNGETVQEIEVRLTAGRPPLYVGIGSQNWLLHEVLDDGIPPRYRRASA